MQISKLRQRIKLIHNTYEELENGDFSQNWNVISHVWAQIKPIGSDGLSPSLGWGKSGDGFLRSLYKVKVRALDIEGLTFEKIIWNKKELKLASLVQLSECTRFATFNVQIIENRQGDWNE